MKTSHGRKQSLLQSLMLVASVLTLVAFTACGKNGGDQAPPPVVGPGTVGPYGTCTTCPAGSALLASGTGNTYYAGQLQGNLNLEFYGTGVQNQAGGQYQQSNYAGSVSAQGTLIWQVASLACGLPAGTYSINTVQPGMWQGTSFYGGMTLQLNGPAQATMRIQGWVAPATPAMIGLDGRQYPYQIVASALVQPTNGGQYGMYAPGCSVDFINMY